ncbi:MAG: protein translocase subunit SecD, partial [Vicinamibacterales bacterium]
MQNLRWKIITILVVLVVFATVGVYPMAAVRWGLPLPGWLADQQIKLGLDLKGGVHLVLRVQTDDALRIETETQSERLREALRTANIPVGSINVVSPTEFRVEGIPADR